MVFKSSQQKKLAWQFLTETAFAPKWRIEFILLREAAKIDGASAWQQWRYLTLPLLRPFINIVLVLNAICVFNSFPLIWVMTQGDPANSTDILVTWLYILLITLTSPCFAWSRNGFPTAQTTLGSGPAVLRQGETYRQVTEFLVA